MVQFQFLSAGRFVTGLRLREEPRPARVAQHVAEAPQQAVQREVAPVDLVVGAFRRGAPGPRAGAEAVPAALEQLRQRPAAVADDRVRVFGRDPVETRDQRTKRSANKHH